MLTAILKHLNGDTTGQVAELKSSPLVIGREPGCGLVVEDRFGEVSRRHAELNAAGGGWTVTDVGTSGKGSSHGTYINGQRIRPNAARPLLPGDELRLGGAGLGAKGFAFDVKDRTVAPQHPDRWLVLDEDNRSLKLDEKPIAVLSPLEFEMTKKLWDAAGKLCTYEEIRLKLWPSEHGALSLADESDRERIAALVRSVRRKVQEKLPEAKVFVNVAGAGYRRGV